MIDYTIEIDDEQIRVQSFADGWEVGQELWRRGMKTVRLTNRAATNNPTILHWEAACDS